MSDYDDLIKKGKKASKKAAKKKTSKKKAKRKPLTQPETETPSRSTKVARIATEAEVRQFVRHWLKCSWDAEQAVARMHPELRPDEIPAVVHNYRRSEHMDSAMVDVMREVDDSMPLSQADAENILAGQATTSILDFLADDATVKPIAELRKMPRRAQLSLKKLKVTKSTITGGKGEEIGERITTEIEGYDIQSAIERLARLRHWGFSEGERDIAEALKKAEARLQSNVIDVEVIDPEE